MRRWIILIEILVVSEPTSYIEKSPHKYISIKAFFFVYECYTLSRIYISYFREIVNISWGKNVNVTVLRPLLCTGWAKWAERPPEVMRRTERSNTLLT